MKVAATVCCLLMVLFTLMSSYSIVQSYLIRVQYDPTKLGNVVEDIANNGLIIKQYIDADSNFDAIDLFGQRLADFALVTGQNFARTGPIGMILWDISELIGNALRWLGIKV